MCFESWQNLFLQVPKMGLSLLMEFDKKARKLVQFSFFGCFWSAMIPVNSEGPPDRAPVGKPFWHGPSRLNKLTGRTHSAGWS